MTAHALNHIPIGHDEVMKQAVEAFASGRMHHAWLLAGIEGIGKATLAWHIAYHALSSGAAKMNPQDQTARLMMAGAHPDLLVVGRAVDEKTGDTRKVIVVEDTLKIASFLRTTSAHGGWRVVIVDEAHALNRHAQNAILKILEEPPAHVLILMTATTPGAMLPTIRSRCRVVPLAPLEKGAMTTILSRLAPEISGTELESLIGLSSGSVGFALKIIRSETLPLYDELLSLLAGQDMDIARLHKLADQISRKADAESFEVVTALLTDRMRQSVRAAALAGQGGVDQALQLWDKTRATFALAETANLDRKLAFVNAVSESYKVKC
ncbi:MAG: DNA polymerase III subunit delta' [Alphaproteobacteria bacterium]|nr:DNA polymerase III subunit delta' [Alphaproteobacteria bacterium]